MKFVNWMVLAMILVIVLLIIANACYLLKNVEKEITYSFYKIELISIFILSLIMIISISFELILPWSFIVWFEIIIFLLIILDKYKINLEHKEISKFKRIDSIIQRLSLSYVYFMILFILILLLLGEMGETCNWNLSDIGFYINRTLGSSLGLSVVFYFVDSKCIEDYINKQILKLYNTIPHWKFTLVSLLVLGIVLSIEYMNIMPQNFQLLLQNFLSPMVAIGISFAGISGLINSIFIDKAEISLAVMYNHQFLKNDDTINAQSGVDVLNVVGTNWGKKVGHLKL